MKHSTKRNLNPVLQYDDAVIRGKTLMVQDREFLEKCEVLSELLRSLGVGGKTSTALFQSETIPALALSMELDQMLELHTRSKVTLGELRLSLATPRWLDELLEANVILQPRMTMKGKLRSKAPFHLNSQIVGLVKSTTEGN